MSEYKYLFSPIKMGNTEVKNRLFASPHGIPAQGFAGGLGSPAQVAYFEERAKGGVGMMGVSTAWIRTPIGLYPGWFFESGNRDHIPLIGNCLKAMRKYDVTTFVQLTWATGSMGVRQPSKDIPHTIWGDNQNREMDEEDIYQLIEDHIQAALNMQEAGAQGVEMPMAGGAGLQVFSSEIYNHRTDEWGGSLENRLRVPLAIAEGIKERCGRDFLVGFNPNVDESTLGGPGLEVGVPLCKMLADSGNVDWLRITSRGQKPQMTQFHYPPSYMAQGTSLYASAAVREAVDDIPIIGGGRVVSPEFSEQALEEGQCDMVWAARSYIVDPEWPNKARAGKEDEIRNCIGDVEGCFLRSCYGMPVGCTCNHEVCHEAEPIGTSEAPKKVLIVGAGPAGLNAAYYAGLRGHDVTLVEKRDYLGGHVHMEAQLPGLTDRADLPRWIGLQLDKMDNVSVELGTEADADYIRNADAQVVILATGSNYVRTGVNFHYLNPVEGWDQDFVTTPEAVILDGEDVGDRVVIFDSTGYLHGAGLAEKLADEGKDVTLVVLDYVVARSTINIGLHQLVSTRLAGKVELLQSTALREIGDDHTLKLQNIMNFSESEIEDVDTVIMVTSRPSNDELYNELKGDIPGLMIIGDAEMSNWNTFCTDNAAKAGRAIALAL